VHELASPDDAIAASMNFIGVELGRKSAFPAQVSA
jgi:hypothetical protein